MDKPVSLYAVAKKSDELMAHAYSKLSYCGGHPPSDISNIKKYQKTVKWILVCFTVFLFPIVKFSKRYCLSIFK